MNEPSKLLEQGMKNLEESVSETISDIEKTQNTSLTEREKLIIQYALEKGFLNGFTFFADNVTEFMYGEG